jgi:hypothetical protein
MKIRALLTLLVVGYVVSPYAALVKLQHDLSTHDVAALRTEIDWDRVRTGLKQDIRATLSGIPAATAIAARTDDDLPAFGSGFAAHLAGSAVDDAITPQHLCDAFSTITPDAGDIAKPTVTGARFDGPTSFRVTIRTAELANTDPPVRLQMRLVLQGWRIGWRVTRVSLPDTLLQQKMANAS